MILVPLDRLADDLAAAALLAALHHRATAAPGGSAVPAPNTNLTPARQAPAREYARVVAELGVSPRSPAAATPAAEGRPELTVNKVLLASLRHADGYHVRPDGLRTHDVAESVMGRSPRVP